MKKFTSYCTISFVMLVAAAAFADSGAASISTIAPSAGASLLKANKVNIRARPSRTAELVTQLKKGDEVKVFETKSVVEAGKTQEWSRITLPATAKCYVLSKLIAGGKATGDGINIRCGPGSNFKEIGKLTKGEKVYLVKAGSEWTQIKPTLQCSGWVASEYLEVAPVPVPVLTPAPPIISNVAEVVSAPIAPPVVVPAPTPAFQSEPETLAYYVVRDGIFQTVDSQEKQEEKMLAPYELMTLVFDRRQYRVAYLDMAEKNLDKYEGKHVRILGNLRWRRGERYPVIIVERIEPVW